MLEAETFLHHSLTHINNTGNKHVWEIYSNNIDHSETPVAKLLAIVFSTFRASVLGFERCPFLSFASIHVVLK